MSYVEQFKHNIECCVAKKTAALITLKSNLVSDPKLEKEINLLNLFSVVVSELDCDDVIPENIQIAVNALCGTSSCFECDSNNGKIIVEDWNEDISSYTTKWIALEECCELAPLPATKWIELQACCERLTD